MNENEHITKENFIAFQYELMNASEKIEFLEHISNCNHCADQFAAMMSEDIIAAPRDMKANILKATKRPDVMLAARARETSKKMQLLLYSLKVCTATVCALLLLALYMNNPLATDAIQPDDTITSQTTDAPGDDASLANAIKMGIDTINDNFLKFSKTIMNTEVFNHD